jgi:hypothetical protein
VLASSAVQAFLQNLLLQSSSLVPCDRLRWCTWYYLHFAVGVVALFRLMDVHFDAVDCCEAVVELGHVLVSLFDCESVMMVDSNAVMLLAAEVATKKKGKFDENFRGKIFFEIYIHRHHGKGHRWLVAHLPWWR